jgi:chromosome segregation ATPase
VDERFEAIDRRFEAVDKRFEAVDRRFEAVDRRFEAVDKRFDEAKEHTSALFERLRDDIRKVAEGVAAQTTALDTFREEIARDRARLDARLDNHEARLTTLERRRRRRSRA